MIEFKTEQTIARSADEVWAYAADIVRHTEWMGVTNARLVHGHGSQVGARARERLLFGPFRWDVEIEVTEAVPGRRIVWRSVSGAPFHGEVVLDLAPIGLDATRATYGTVIQLHGMWRLLTPFVAMEGKAGQARELSRLKEQLERAPAMAQMPS